MKEIFLNNRGLCSYFIIGREVLLKDAQLPACSLNRSKYAQHITL